MRFLYLPYCFSLYLSLPFFFLLPFPQRLLHHLDFYKADELQKVLHHHQNLHLQVYVPLLLLLSLHFHYDHQEQSLLHHMKFLRSFLPLLVVLRLSLHLNHRKVSGGGLHHLNHHYLFQLGHLLGSGTFLGYRAFCYIRVGKFVYL